MEEEKNQQEYVNVLLKIIREDLPIISKYNIHLYQNILSAIELVMDQSYQYIEQTMDISEETKEEVDKIISEIELEE